jgi:hypothetical protein
MARLSLRPFLITNCFNKGPSTRNPATEGDRRAGSLDPGPGWGKKSRVHRNNAAAVRLVPGTALVLGCSIGMLSRAQWYREQANLALQRGHETRDPTLRAGFDELMREWLRLAEQAEWIANQQQPPVAKRISRRNRTGS